MTERQKRFCEEYLIDLNATQAAIRAGYSPKTANEQGCQVLANISVRARIDEALAERSRRTGVNQDRVIRELARVAFANATDVVDFETAELIQSATSDDTAAIASVKVKTIPTSDGLGIEREIRMADKLKALELLGRHMGMFTDNLKVAGDLGVQIIDDISSPDNSG